MPGAEGIGSMTGYKSYLYKKINGKDKGGGGKENVNSQNF